MRLSPASLLALALLLPACSSPAADPSPSGAPARPATVVALGDSVAAGVGAPTRDQGYVGLLAEGLRERLGCGRQPEPDGCPLQLQDLAVSGATTTTVLSQQLPRAREVLRAAADPRLVTLTVGGNDLFGPVVLSCAADARAASCRTAVETSLQAVRTGVGRVLDGIDEAAGPGTTVAVMTYADPVPACRLAPLSALSAQVLEGSGDQPGLNDVLREQARAHDAVVVDTYDLLEAPQDFVGGDDCLHPSGSGHAKTAQAFLDAVGARVAG